MNFESCRFRLATERKIEFGLPFQHWVEGARGDPHPPPFGAAERGGMPSSRGVSPVLGFSDS
jgi:hypothetical protein